MPISYSASFYTNETIMRTEQLILERFQTNKSPMTKEELQELTGGVHWGNVERALTQIRRYDGYKVEVTKRDKITRYQVIYEFENDPWAFLFRRKYNAY